MSRVSREAEELFRLERQLSFGSGGTFRRCRSLLFPAPYNESPYHTDHLDFDAGDRLSRSCLWTALVGSATRSL